MDECNHDWEFHRDLNGNDDYFECKKCGKQAPYCPEDLGDYENERI